MPKLVSVEVVRRRGGLQDIDEVNVRLSAALDAATLHLAGMLRTDFVRGTYQDQYWLDPQEKPYTDDFVRLLLTNGFVDGTQPFELRTAVQLADLALEDPVNSDYIKRHDERGTLLITGTDTIRPPLRPFFLEGQQFMQIDYTSGFTTVATEYGQLYIGVPTWLVEAATLTGLTLVGASTTCIEIEGKDKKLHINLLPLVESHIRYFPSALAPLS